MVQLEGDGSGEAATVKVDRPGDLAFSCSGEPRAEHRHGSRPWKVGHHQAEPERPRAHPGSSGEADDRKPQGDLLRAKSDLPAEGKTEGMKEGDQPEDDSRDKEERLLVRHWDIPAVLM